MTPTSPHAQVQLANKPSQTHSLISRIPSAETRETWANRWSLLLHPIRTNLLITIKGASAVRRRFIPSQTPSEVIFHIAGLDRTFQPSNASWLNSINSFYSSSVGLLSLTFVSVNSSNSFYSSSVGLPSLTFVSVTAAFVSHIIISIACLVSYIILLIYLLSMRVHSRQSVDRSRFK